MPTDDELNAALEGSLSDEQDLEAAGGQKDEGSDDEQKLEEHKERSKLGRRVSEMETQMTTFLNKMDAFLQSQQKPKEAPKAPELDNEGYMTLADYQRLRDYEKQVEMHQATEYEEGYYKQLKALGVDEDPEIHTELVKMVTEPGSPFNRKHSEDPMADAERNYLRAARSLIKRQNDGKANPLKGKGSENAYGVGGDDAIKGKEPKIPELDEVTQEYVNKMGVSKEMLLKAFGKG